MGYQKEIQEMENKMKKPILDKVRAVINTVSKKQNVDVTFGKLPTAPVVYAKMKLTLLKR